MGGSGGGGRGHGALEGWGRVLAPRTPWAWPWAWPCLGFCLVTCSRSVGPWWGWAGWFWAGGLCLVLPGCWVRERVRNTLGGVPKEVGAVLRAWVGCLHLFVTQKKWGKGVVNG